MSQNKPKWRVLLPREGKMGGVDIYDGEQYVCQMSHHPAQRDQARQYAERIVSCMNACEGVPDGMIHDGAYREMMQAQTDLTAQRTQLLAALSDALEWIDAVPSNIPLPAMPGFDRDAVNELIAAAKGGV